MSNPSKITVHATATKPDHDVTIAEVNNWHYGHRSWRKYQCPFTGLYVGYHWLIRRDGTITKGRDERTIGVHTGGHNTGNIGIALAGGVDDTGRPACNYTDAQWDSLRWLISDIAGRHGIAEDQIKGHRDYSPDRNGDGVITPNEYTKACPCFDVQAKLQEWKT